MKKDKINSVLGYEAGAELRKMILRTATEKNIPVLEAASEYQMPEMMILGSDGRGNVDGKRMTPQEFHTENPYRRLVVIRRRRQTGGVTNTE